MGHRFHTRHVSVVQETFNVSKKHGILPWVTEHSTSSVSLIGTTFGYFPFPPSSLEPLTSLSSPSPYHQRAVTFLGLTLALLGAPRRLLHPSEDQGTEVLYKPNQIVSVGVRLWMSLSYHGNFKSRGNRVSYANFAASMWSFIILKKGFMSATHITNAVCGLVILASFGVGDIWTLHYAGEWVLYPLIYRFQNISFQLRLKLQCLLFSDTLSWLHFNFKNSG